MHLRASPVWSLGKGGSGVGNRCRFHIISKPDVVRRIPYRGRTRDPVCSDSTVETSTVICGERRIHVDAEEGDPPPQTQGRELRPDQNGERESWSSVTLTGGLKILWIFEDENTKVPFGGGTKIFRV